MTNSALYLLEPEVAGELGPQTVFGPAGIRGHRAVVDLHYEFHSWLGDDLIESHPCQIVSVKLMRRIEEAHLTGAAFDSLVVTTSEDWKQLADLGRRMPALPDFVWVRPQGRVIVDGPSSCRDWSGHEISHSQDSQLVVTARALGTLRAGGLAHCDIHELTLAP
jgi:hypothetical protein